MKISKLFNLTFLSLYVGLTSYVTSPSWYSKWRLEQDAFLCGPYTNLHGFNFKNKDIDGNGLLESIVISKNENGEKVYQNVVKHKYGFTLSEPKLYSSLFKN